MTGGSFPTPMGLLRLYRISSSWLPRWAALSAERGTSKAYASVVFSFNLNPTNSTKASSEDFPKPLIEAPANVFSRHRANAETSICVSFKSLLTKPEGFNVKFSPIGSVYAVYIK